MTAVGKKLRVGIIGAGGIGRTHAKYLTGFKDVELVAACDVSEATLARFAEAYPQVRTYPAWEALLADAKPDAVTVCTPNGVHCRPTIDALQAGCHVMVEKPMALSVAEADAMVAAAVRGGRRLVIGFQHRYDGRVQVLRRAFDEGVFGKVLYVRVQALRRRGIPNWGVFGRKDIQGGGPMIDIGVHCIEMAHYAIGLPRPAAASGSIWTYLGNQPCRTFCAWPDWDHKTYTVEDLAVGRIRMADGAVIHIEASFAAHIERDVWSFQIFGEKGGATLDPLMIFRDDAGSMLNCTPAFVPKVDIFERKMRDFVDVCLTGRDSRAPGEHGLAVQKMLNGVYDSAERGGVEVPIA
jgi:predicted dehydrogenase